MSVDPAELLREVMRRDFLTFAYHAYAMLYARELRHNWHHQAIAHALTTLGNAGRLAIFLPPRNLKSFLVSIAWPAWMLGRDPTIKFLCASYGADLAEDLARTSLRLMSSRFYLALFPQTRVHHRKAVADFKTTRGGGRKSVSVGGPGTGFGGDYVIIDDPMKADDVNHEAALKKAEGWFQDSIVTRGDDKTMGAQILLMQRIHEADLGGYVTGLGWPELCLPAINDKDRLVPISRTRSHHWPAGALLHPEHEPQVVLDELLKVQGPRRFSAQYLQKPLPAMGALIKRDWIKTYDGMPEALRGGEVIQSWDMAASLSEAADFSACVTVRKIGNRFYVIDVFRGRLPFDLLRQKVVELAQRWHPSAILIENTSSGAGMIQDLTGRPVAGLASIVKINPGILSKYERLDAQTALIAAGDLLVPAEAPWLIDFLHELLGFPNAAHDDMVDALAHLLGWAKRLLPPTPNVGPEIIIVGDDLGFNAASDAFDTDAGEIEDPWSGL